MVINVLFVLFFGGIVGVIGGFIVGVVVGLFFCWFEL